VALGAVAERGGEIGAAVPKGGLGRVRRKTLILKNKAFQNPTAQR